MKTYTLAALLILIVTGSLWAQDATPVTPGTYSVSAGNSIRQWITRKPESNAANVGLTVDLGTGQMKTTYMDGLGRPIQTVEQKNVYVFESLNFYDRVTPVVYDTYGRIQREYLPYQPMSNNGSFKTTAFADQQNYYSDASGRSPIHGQGETFYYGKTEYEPSPLNRVIKTFAPGNNWVNQGRGIQNDYWTNTITDSVKIWTVTVSSTAGTFSSYTNAGNYAAGELSKSVITDEHNRQSITFTDRLGLVILKKVQLNGSSDTGTGSGHVGWLCTYYLYDNYNQLRAVIQPEGVKKIAPSFAMTTPVLNDFMFRYEYDAKNHLIMKKVAGAGEIYMVYDKRDRLVLSQDANQRADGKWMYMLYDAINRPIQTGWWNTATSFSSHITAAAGSTAYPNLSGQSIQIMTKTFYDNYSWRPAEGNPHSTTYNTSWNNHFLAASTTSAPFPEVETTASSMTKGLVTGTWNVVLGAGALITVKLYDRKSRVIQESYHNIGGGTDILTTQYTWDGRVLNTVHNQTKPGVNSQTTTVVTLYNYDVIGALISFHKRFSNSLINGGAMGGYQGISYFSKHDIFGRPRDVSAGNIESQKFDYNIRGWLLGVNRDYAKNPATTGKYFGYDLGYDKGSVGSIGTYSTPQYGGNISGTVWRSRGDEKIKKYDYGYDAVNRISSGSYNQHITGTTWNNTLNNNSISNITYDANGNIRTLNRKTGANDDLDLLTYTYMGNQLKKVDDTGDAAKGFRDGVNLSEEYFYDSNGNTTRDLNKGLDNSGAAGIIYNTSNLPTTVYVTGKGSIDYLYDAYGVKMKQVVHENSKPDKTTLYLSGIAYEDNVLQYITHEEGRIVRKPDNTLGYEFFLKDHLENVRMTVRKDLEVVDFPATFESENAVEEEAVYSYLAQTREPYNNADANGDGGNEVVRLNAAKPSGAGLTLPVTKGDELDMSVYAYYEGGSGYTSTINLTAFIAGVATTFGGLNGGTATEQATFDAMDGAYQGGAAGMSGTSNDLVPAAYINYILFDENMVSYQFGHEQISTSANMNHEQISIPNITVSKKGYAYVYLTNESGVGHVYFDDMLVTLTESRIVQENDYEPFGLTFNSFMRETSKPQNFQYSGKELQNDLDLGWTNFGARMYDPTLGRWLVNDPLAEKMRRHSPYNYAFNNPLRFIDPDGMAAFDLHILGDEEEAKKVLKQLQQSTSLKLSRDAETGKVSATGKAKTDADKTLLSAINDEKIDVRVEATSSNFTKDDKWFVGGAFHGSTVDKDGKVTANQTVNPEHTKDIDEFYEAPKGVSVMHEVLEAYIGAQDSPGTGQPSFDPNTLEYKNYISAHNKTDKIDPRHVAAVLSQDCDSCPKYINKPHPILPQLNIEKMINDMKKN